MFTKTNRLIFFNHIILKSVVKYKQTIQILIMQGGGIKR